MAFFLALFTGRDSFAIPCSTPTLFPLAEYVAFYVAFFEEIPERGSGISSHVLRSIRSYSLPERSSDLLWTITLRKKLVG